MSKICGIYRIVSPSNKVYIGQSCDIIRRFWEHRSIYDNKDKTILYHSILKYGPENHFFEIIHELPFDAEQPIIDKYELLYYQFYKDCGFEMLNTKEPFGHYGKMSEETKRKISIAQKGKVISEESRKRNSEAQKKKYLEDKKNGIVRKHSEETKLKMSEKAKGHKRTLGFKHTEETKLKRSISRKGIKFPQLKVKVCQYDLQMNLIKIHDSVLEAEKSVGARINGCLSKKFKTCKGFIWRYYCEMFEGKERKLKKKTFSFPQKRKKVCQYDLEMNLIKIYDSISEAEKEVKGQIIAALKGKQKIAKGFIWKYF